MRPPALLFGIPIDDVTMTETLDRIGELITAGRAAGRTHQVATVNVDFLVNSLANPELADILRLSDLNLADGMPVVWGARKAGSPLRRGPPRWVGTSTCSVPPPVLPRRQRRA
jgi:N-acetylglucosaminyldiphosphoundecaprenol N-acetyl-beta-D-mannosaminyltransferase